MSQELETFVRDALSRDLPRTDIRSTLAQAGWPADAVDAALDRYADVEFPLPVPRPRPYVSAREAFAYLVVFSTLYAGALALGSLLFGLIELAWPDAAMHDVGQNLARHSLRWSMSWLVIAFPVFLVSSYRTSRALRLEPGKRASRVRKWLIYVTLFVAASVLIGDLVTLVYNLLGGELTTRFVLKVSTVAAIAGCVFGYYTLELRRDDLTPAEMTAPRPAVRRLAVAVGLAVAAALAAGFVVVGSPGRARAFAVDDRRTSDLNAIADAIDGYRAREGALPATLAELERQRNDFVPSIGDPATGVPYEYEITGAATYRLCAAFDASNRDSGPGRATHLRFWRHDAGRQCFDLEAAEPVGALP